MAGQKQSGSTGRMLRCPWEVTRWRIHRRPAGVNTRDTPRRRSRTERGNVVVPGFLRRSIRVKDITQRCKMPVRLTRLNTSASRSSSAVILQKMSTECRALGQIRVVMQHRHRPAPQTDRQQQAENLPPQSAANCHGRMHSRDKQRQCRNIADRASAGRWSIQCVRGKTTENSRSFPVRLPVNPRQIRLN